MTACETIPSFLPGEWERPGDVQLEETLGSGVVEAGALLGVVWVQQNNHGAVMLEALGAASGQGTEGWLLPVLPQDVPGLWRALGCSWQCLHPSLLLLHCPLFPGRFKPPKSCFHEGTDGIPAEVCLTWAAQRSYQVA